MYLSPVFNRLQLAGPQELRDGIIELSDFHLVAGEAWSRAAISFGHSNTIHNEASCSSTENQCNLPRKSLVVRHMVCITVAHR
jgi:hypothetical protein